MGIFMYKNLKKIGPLSAVAFLAGSSMLNAVTDSAQLRNIENRLSSLEQRKNAGGMINPPGRPQVRDGVNLFLTGELLYWNAHENGLNFAVVNDGSSANISDATIKSVHSNWDVGFRVGVGYNLPHDGWDLSLSWLRFNTHGSTKIHFDNDSFVFPSRIQPADPFSGSTTTKANSEWKLLFNQLDFDLGREFFVSKWLTIRPHFGIRTDWVHQRWTNHYNNFIGTLPPVNVKIAYNDKWWGIGPEAGIDTQWGLGAGFSLFANASGGIAYGFHDISFSDKDSTSAANLADVHQIYRISHPMLDFLLGLRFDSMFYNDRFHLGLQVGWEHHVYFNQNQFPVFVNGTSLGDFVSNQGDLAFQGWTFGVRFDF